MAKGKDETHARMHTHTQPHTLSRPPSRPLSLCDPCQGLGRLRLWCDGVAGGPAARVLVIELWVVGEDVCNLGHKRVLWIWLTEQRGYGEKDMANLKRGAPL